MVVKATCFSKAASSGLTRAFSCVEQVGNGMSWAIAVCLAMYQVMQAKKAVAEVTQAPQNSDEEDVFANATGKQKGAMAVKLKSSDEETTILPLRKGASVTPFPNVEAKTKSDVAAAETPASPARQGAAVPKGHLAGERDGFRVRAVSVMRHVAHMHEDFGNASASLKAVVDEAREIERAQLRRRQQKRTQNRHGRGSAKTQATEAKAETVMVAEDLSEGEDDEAVLSVL